LKSSSSSAAATTTTTKDNRALLEGDGIIVTDGSNLEYTATDFGAIEKAFDFAEATNTAAFSFGGDALRESTELTRTIFDQSKELLQASITTIARDNEARRVSESEATLKAIGQTTNRNLLILGGTAAVIATIFIYGKAS
jgi:hypothetical protein